MTCSWGKRLSSAPRASCVPDSSCHRARSSPGSPRASCGSLSPRSSPGKRPALASTRTSPRAASPPCARWRRLRLPSEAARYARATPPCRCTRSSGESSSSVRGRRVGSIRVQDPEGCRNARIEEAHRILTQVREEPLRLLLGHQKLNFDGERAGELEEVILVQHVVAAEPRHGTKCRAAANAEAVGLLEQPFPHQPPVVTVAFVNVESQERDLHAD